MRAGHHYKQLLDGAVGRLVYFQRMQAKRDWTATAHHDLPDPPSQHRQTSSTSTSRDHSPSVAYSTTTRQLRRKSPPGSDHQVYVKITEVYVPEDPPRRDSNPLIVKKQLNFLSLLFFTLVFYISFFSLFNPTDELWCFSAFFVCLLSI